MKAEKTEKGVAVEFSDSEVDQIVRALTSFESDRALRELGIKLFNLFSSVNKK